MKIVDARAGVCLEIQHPKPSQFPTQIIMPAPLKNRNAYRHGLRSNQTSDASVNQQLRAFRRTIREEIAPDGRLTVAQEAMIQSLVRWESRCLLAGHYLRREPKLPIERRMELLATITAATAERDKVLRQLGIVGIAGKAAAGSDLWDALDESPVSPANASGDVRPPDSLSDATKAPPAGSQANGEPDPRLPNPANGETSNAVIQDHPAGEATSELRSRDCHTSQNRTRAETPQGLATETGKPD